MKLTRFLCSVFFVLLIPQHLFAQTSNDPESLLQKMADRSANANLYQINGNLRITIKPDWKTVRKTAKSKKQRTALEKGIIEVGNAIFVDGNFAYARKDNKSRLEMTFHRISGSGKSKETGNADTRFVIVSDGIKSYSTLLGSHMDESENSPVLSMIFAPDASDLKCRMLPATTLNKKMGFPIEILDEEKKEKNSIRLIYTLEPKTAQLLKMELIFTEEPTWALSFTPTYESVSPILKDDLFQPALPGKPKPTSGKPKFKYIDLSVFFNSMVMPSK